MTLVASAYTHYFALLATAVATTLLIAQAYQRRNGTLKPLLITVGISVAAYLPWLYFGLAQVLRVSKGFWIPEPNFVYMVFALVAPFTYKFEVLMFPWQAVASLIV